MSRPRPLSGLCAAILVLGAIAGAHAVAGTDVPLTTPPFAIFGPGHLDVVVAGNGTFTQPASFSVVVPAGATIEGAYLYVNGRGAPDSDIVLNGNPLSVPIVATAGPLPFDASQSTYTQRADITALVGPGTTNFTITGYSPSTPGGAVAVVVYRHAAAPVQTIRLTEGADYGFHGFAPPFGPDTEVGRIDFAAAAAARTATFYMFSHDSQPTGGDAVWFLSADAGSLPVPASLVGGVSGATALEIDLLGVSVASGGYSPSPELDIFAEVVTVPAGANYVAFQIESPPDRGTRPQKGDSVTITGAILALEADTICGDGVVDPGEECDDGANNSDTIPNACRTDCTRAVCPDGVVDPGEECDDGANNSDTTPGACRTDCTMPSCPDGVVDPGEECDDGANNSDTIPDACRTDCTRAHCPDGVVDTGEECDDGNTVPGDGCDAQCLIDEICIDFVDNDGDGLIDCVDPDCECLPIGRDPGTIRFGPPNTGPGHDKFRVHGRFVPASSVNPVLDGVGVLLTNANGIIYKAELGPGVLTGRGRRWKYRDRLALTNGGIARLTVHWFKRRGYYSFDLTAVGDLSAATLAEMTVQWRVGDDQFANTSVWTETPTGWLLELPPL